jgi:general secretion pathway protein H
MPISPTESEARSGTPPIAHGGLRSNANGGSSSIARSGARSNARGFTLLETLVVVGIAGVLVALAAVNFMERPGAALRTEAERLAARLAQAHDEAMLGGARLAWRGADDGYAWLRADGDGALAPATDDAALGARRWPRGIRLAAVEANAGPAPDATLVFRVSGRNRPYRIVLTDGERRAVLASDGLRPPQVALAER